MINVSNEYRKYVADNKALPRNFTAKAEIALLDGTILNITEEDIVLGGLKINDATSASNSFQIGSAIINQCTLMLNNIGGKFDQYDFTDAIIRPYVGLRLSATTEWIKKGIFTVDEPTLASSIISLVALDNMNKFDTPFSGVNISFPCTVSQLLQAVCLYCQVPLQTVSFTNSNHVIDRKPNDEATTCREIISYIAQLSGNFARINIDGALELKWYDMTSFEQADNLDGGIFDNDTPYSTGDNVDGGDFTFTETEHYDGGTFKQMDRYHHIHALNQATIGTDDVIITGIRVKAQGTESDYGETVLFGTTGYVIEITNPLIQENTASIIANSVGAKIVGMRFRPYSVSALSDPSREAGDVAYLSHKNNTYQVLLTNISYQIGSSDSISCDAETPSKKQSVRFDAGTKAIIEARNAAKQELTSYDLRVKQMTDLITNGFGLFKTEVMDDNGGIIYYMHDQPTIEESEYRWFMTTGGIISQKKVLGEWQTLSGVSKDGNALYNIVTAFNLEVGNEIQMAPDATINWGNIDVPSDLAYSDDIPSDSYITNITKNSITSSYIKGLNLEVGNEIKMGANAIITWDNLSEESKENLTGEDGRDGVDGKDGRDGRDGSDANVPSYITSTKITQTTIESPSITGGIVTGTEINNGNGTFRVTQDGSVYMTKANIETESINNQYVTMYGSRIDGGRQVYGTSYTIGTAEYTGASRSGVVQLFGYTSGTSTSISRQLNIGNNSLLVKGANLVLGGSAGESYPTIITRTALTADITRSVSSDVALYVRGGLQVTGSIIGNLNVSDDLVCSNYTASTQSLNLKPNNGSGIGNIFAFGNVRPSNGQDLGGTTTAYRWSNVYIKTGAINESSDIRLKNNITDIPKDLLRFFADEVKPKMFEANGKTHFGYIAQDVERALYKYALDKVGLENAQEYVDKFNLLGKDESYLSLVYNQVAVLKEVEMQDRIDRLESQIEELKGG